MTYNYLKEKTNEKKINEGGMISFAREEWRYAWQSNDDGTEEVMNW